MTLLGLDPGKNWFGYSVVKVKFDPPFRYKVVTTGLVENVVYDLTKGIRFQSRSFKREISGLLRSHGADILIAERYQNRGRMMGATIELVNYMLGVMDSLRVQDYVVITAAQWKNAFNKHYDLKEFYRELPLVPHRVDATLIALYGAHQYIDEASKQFDFLSDAQSIQTLRDRISATAN